MKTHIASSGKDNSLRKDSQCEIRGLDHEVRATLSCGSLFRKPYGVE